MGMNAVNEMTTLVPPTYPELDAFVCPSETLPPPSFRSQVEAEVAAMFDTEEV